MTRQNQEKGEDSYLASLSDLMVGMLFVFIIILMSFALKLRMAETDLHSRTQEVERLKEELNRIKRKLTRDDELRQDMLKEIQKTLENQGVTVILDLRNGILRLPEELLFESGSADFNSVGVDAVGKLARTLAEVFPCYSAGDHSSDHCPPNVEPIRMDVILVEGHTDNIPINRRDYVDNWALSLARARNTYTLLQTVEPALGNYQNSHGQSLFSMSAYADTRPVADNSTESGRRQNRRIDLRFILATPDPEEIRLLEQKLNQP